MKKQKKNSTLAPKTPSAPEGCFFRSHPQISVDRRTASSYSYSVALLEVFVRTTFEISLALFLGVAMVGAPVMAAPANPASAPLGVVLQADRAQVGADLTSGGADVYDGEDLLSDVGGAPPHHKGR